VKTNINNQFGGEFMKKQLIKGLAAAAAVLCVTSAYSVPTLRISDGVNPDVVVTDGGAGDSNPLVGAVTWIGSIGVWVLNVDTGVTKPILGSATDPHMDLNYVVSSTGAGTMVISFSDDGFTYSGALTDHWGGTTSGTSINRVLENGQSTGIGMGPFGPGAFSGTTSGTIDLVPTDVLTLQVAITHTGSGPSSGDKEITVPEGGMTLTLLGSALVGIGFLRRKLGIKA
jgi:hypothetical protein